MIGMIKGNIVFVGEKFFIIDVSGVGYKVFITNDLILSKEISTEITLWTYTAVRENSIDLYGFIDNETLNFFEMILSVSGIGPKSALSILSIAPIESLCMAIAKGDTGYLNKVSGIGRKTAEKIVIELRDKLKEWGNEDKDYLRDENDVIEALKSLGYSQNQARDSVKKISTEITGTNNRVKEALKILNTNN